MKNQNLPEKSNQTKHPGGRPLGSGNKITQKMVRDIIAAYKLRGGVQYLRELPDELFVKCLLRLMPQQIKADVQGSMSYTVQIVDFAGAAKPVLPVAGETTTCQPAIAPVDCVSVVAAEATVEETEGQNESEEDL